MAGCGAPMMTAGRRRKTVRKMKGGNFYGAAGAIAPGAMQWSSVENVAAKPDGTLIPNGDEMKATKLGGRRRRSRKTARKTRGRRRRGGVEEPKKSSLGPSSATTDVAGEGPSDKPSEVVERPVFQGFATKPESGPTTGSLGPAATMGSMGGKKRRKTKKAARKGGKHRRGHKSTRKMRGGANWVSSAGVGAAFKGDGVAGLGNYSAYGAKMPVSGGPAQNPDGAYRA